MTSLKHSQYIRSLLVSICMVSRHKGGRAEDLKAQNGGRRLPFYLLGLSKRCFVGEGTTVPVEEADESLADLACFSLVYSSSSFMSSASSSSLSSKMSGASGGSLANCALAKDL